MEIITTDQPGLLSEISKAFVEHDVHINSARITTIGSRVEDIFSITNSVSKPITDQDQLSKIKDSIIANLEAEKTEKNE
jgi:[protein-PII] uridylyltransferase